MAGSLNKVILIGRLGRDPEMRYTPSGQPVANFSLATDESYTGKDGQKVQKTEWHKVVVWGKQAEFCGNYLSKGRLVYIEGKLETRRWTDKDGVEKYTTEIKADRVLGLDSAQGQAGAGAPPAQGQEYGGREENNSMGDAPF
jgi:single-strand DNA-binding protein